MNDKSLATRFILCCVAVAIALGTAEPMIGADSGAILSGGCAGGGINQGVPEVVFLMGEYGNIECTFEAGPPTRGIPMPSAGTLLNLRVTDDPSNQGSSVTIYVNGKATALTCTEGTSGKCSDTKHKIRVKAGDEAAATYTSSTGNLTNAGMIMSLEKR